MRLRLIQSSFWLLPRAIIPPATPHVRGRVGCHNFRLKARLRKPAGVGNGRMKGDTDQEESSAEEGVLTPLKGIPIPLPPVLLPNPLETGPGLSSMLPAPRSRMPGSVLLRIEAKARASLSK
jgi:hypothetical protein